VKFSYRFVFREITVARNVYSSELRVLHGRVVGDFAIAVF